MSRMFNVLSGGSQLRKAEPAPEREPIALSVAAAVEEIPFVEIGDPNGPVFSPALNVLKVAQEPAKSEEPAPVEPTFPRLATQKYLSVKFHDLTERSRHDAAREGPDAGLVAFHIPDHPVSGEYRTLRDAVGGQLPELGPKVLWFTAAAAEAGTTSVLLNLAITIARDASKRVVVVDANAERPAVAEKFALGAAAPGLAEVLSEKTPLAWAVQATTMPNLQVLPAGPAALMPGAVSRDLPKAIEQLRQWYDWVLVDSGIWGAMAERDAICSAANAVYLVSREADVDRPEFAGVRGWVRELGGLLRGYIATRI
ncbi:MAG TPA: hypothetical protein VGI99_04775 [Gemmataceae bacterium]